MSQNIKEQLLPAFIQSLIICILRFFTIPWSIWSGAVIRLAAARQLSDQDRELQQKTEFPVLQWVRSAWDGAIFLAWPIGVIAVFIAAIQTIFGVFISGLIVVYFSVIIMSMMKESLILILSIALNVERIASRSDMK